MSSHAIQQRWCIHALLTAGAISMTADSAFGGIIYLQQSRSLFARQSSVTSSQTNTDTGVWNKTVIATAPGGGSASAASIQSDLSVDGINVSFDVSSDDGGGGSLAVLTTIRLNEASLVSFAGSYGNFVTLPITSFAFSLVGNGYSYSFVGDPDIEFNEFAQNSITLGPGDYTLEFRVETLAFNGLNGQLYFDVAPVPAPGAVGFAIAGAAALAGRSRREESNI